LSSKQKLRQCEIPEAVSFWKWVDANTLGVVGLKKVYHVDITNTNPPTEIMERAQQLASCLIMNYGVDKSNKWAFVVGLGKNAQGGIQCQMQLYSIERKQQQILEGVAGAFADVQVTEAQGYKNSLFCFCEKKASEQVQRLHIMEIGNPAPGQQKFKKTVDIQFPADVQGDMPLIVHCVEKYGTVFVITKLGYLYMFEMSQAVLLFRQRITDQTMVVSCKNSQTDGMIAINAAGQILSINVEENNLIPFISANPSLVQDNVGLSFKLAQRFGLKGADDLFVQQFNRLLASGDYAGAAKVASTAPGELLRNQETINKFKSLPTTGGPLPIMVYFSTLLQSTKLNALESVELARPVLQQGKANMIEEWIKQDKLTASDQLSDVIRQFDPNLAAALQVKSGNPDLVIQGLIGMGQFDKIMTYCQQQNHTPDFNRILRQVVPVNAEAAVGLALMVTSRENGQQPKVPIDAVAQIFLENNKVKETTAFLLRALENNRPDESHLQTKLFEINLMSNPQIAEGIFQMNKFTQFDRERVAKMCEQVGLYGRALQNYTSMGDIKRVMLNTHGIPKEQLIEYFGRLGEEDALACMYDLLKSNKQNMGVVAEIAVKYSAKIDTKKSIQVLESFGTSEGMLFFLASVLPTTEDPEIYFKYIEACTRLGNYKEVERVIKETDYYDAVKVKDFLKDAKLADPRPLIHLCEKHQYIDELTRYLFNNKQKQFIEIYLHRVNQAAAPKVLGTLLEVDCDEVYIKQLLNSIRACPIEELVEEFQKKGKLKLLQGWLESRNDERITETALHNALAIIYIDINKDPQNFLINNQYYDSKVVGKYCEDRNPDLAFIAYKRAWGSCDMELVEVTNKNYLFRLQARYLVERQSPELWAHVLQEDNPSRKQVIDQIVTIALPETKNPDEVSTTVKAFMDADMPNELIELLEKIVLHNSDFAANKNLQNLLILTAIKADTSRVMDYINRLDQYDGQELAKIARKDQYKLYDEAFAIY
jgi:clathrin heavy chain